MQQTQIRIEELHKEICGYKPIAEQIADKQRRHEAALKKVETAKEALEQARTKLEEAETNVMICRQELNDVLEKQAGISTGQNR